MSLVACLLWLHAQRVPQAPGHSSSQPRLPLSHASLLLPATAVGQASADAFGFFLGSQWVWGAVGYCWFWLLLCSTLGILALKYTNPPSPRPTGAHAPRRAWRRCHSCPHPTATFAACRCP